MGPAAAAGECLCLTNNIMTRCSSDYTLQKISKAAEPLEPDVFRYESGAEAEQF